MSERLNDVLLKHLDDLLATEPPQDAGGHPGPAVHERVGAEWALWSRRVSAVRTLLAPRLVDQALDDYRNRAEGSGS